MVLFNSQPWMVCSFTILISFYRIVPVYSSYNDLKNNLRSLHLFNNTGSIDTVHNTKTAVPLVEYGDSIYVKGDWDGAPIVLEKYKLIFFTVAKVGSTEWKRLFRRFEGYSKWDKDNDFLTNNPELNGLKYLYDYDRETASQYLEDPDWTKAIFVGDPIVRFVSTYFDHIEEHDSDFESICCQTEESCIHRSKESIEEFFDIIRFCSHSSWNQLSKRIREEKYWSYINFVGHIETITDDAERLLRSIGAWDDCCVNGWGKDGFQTFFESKSYTKSVPIDEVRLLVSTDLEGLLEDFYHDDYEIPYLNLTKIHINNDILTS